MYPRVRPSEAPTPLPTGSLEVFRLALVAEPDPDLQQIYALLLAREGVGSVITADTGTEALAIALAESPDLILTEVGLPNLDGMALLRQLRDNAGTRASAAVVITALTGAALQRKAADLGVAMLLHKPVSFRTLGATLGTGLSRWSSRAGYSSRTGAL